MKKAYVLLFEGYADWEIGHVLAELKRLGQLEVVSVGFNEKPLASMGSLQVKTHQTLDQINFEEILIFILPGGYMWERGYPEDVMNDLLRQLDERNIPIAAICAATTVLAKAGILKGRKHTSNSLKYIKETVPDYSDDDYYIDKMAVCDQHIITASGLGSVDFTMEILKKLDVSSSEMRTIWYDAFKHGKYPDDFAHSA